MTNLDCITSRKDSVGRIGARGQAAGFIEVTCVSVWEDTDKRVYLSIAAILGAEPLKACYCEHRADPSKECICAKTRIHLRNKSSLSSFFHDGRNELEVREDYATVGRLIQRAQREGFATAASNVT